MFFFKCCMSYITLQSIWLHCPIGHKQDIAVTPYITFQSHHRGHCNCIPQDIALTPYSTLHSHHTVHCNHTIQYIAITSHRTLQSHHTGNHIQLSDLLVGGILGNFTLKSLSLLSKFCGTTSYPIKKSTRPVIGFELSVLELWILIFNTPNSDSTDRMMLVQQNLLK